MMNGRGPKGRVEREEAAAEPGLEIQGSKPDRQLKTKFGDRLHLTRNEQGLDPAIPTGPTQLFRRGRVAAGSAPAS